MKIEKLEPAAGATENGSIAPKKKGFWALNWLRFILAIYIVLFHTLRNYSTIEGSWFEATLGLGNLATSGFFVLSGFLLTYAYVVSKNGREIDRTNFLAARFSTLYPLHIAGLILAAIPMAQTIYSQGGINVPTEISGTAVRMLTNAELVGNFLLNVLLLNAWNPYYLSFNYPSWSLSALGCYYLLFPVIAPRLYRMKSPVTGLVLLGIAFLLPGVIADGLQLTDVVTDGVLHHNPVIRLPLFVAGIVLCVLFYRTRTHGSPLQLVVLNAILLATAAVGTYLVYHESRLHVIRNGLYYPASLALIWLCAAARPISNAKILYWGERLGAASLPLFLLHGPTFSLYRLVEKFVLGMIYSPDWSRAGIVAAGRVAEPSFLLYGVYLAALIWLCVFVQERFVAPFQIRIRNIVSARRAARVEQKASLTGTE